MDEKQKNELTLKITRSFSPSTPIDKHMLFAGRTDQLSSIIKAVSQRGQKATSFLVQNR